MNNTEDASPRATAERPAEKIRWAAKVQPGKVRRLYERDAMGIVDDHLIDEVGLALHARCVSIVLVNDGMMRCPRCGSVFKVHRTYRERVKGEPTDDLERVDPERVVPCPDAGCDWHTTIGQWWHSWRHRELHAGWGLPPLRDFAERYPSARTPRERMLMIDRLLHQFHTNLKRGIQGRPVAVNLIEGNIRQVRALLDSLAEGVTPAGEGPVPGRRPGG
jgi:hypothetical protein